MEDADTLPTDFDELDDAACKRALAVLIDVGTALALECKAPGPDATLADRSKAYDRVALAVRRTILLFQHLKHAFVDPEIRNIQARKRIIRAVEDTIERKADPADADALRVELVERLESPDFADDIARRSPGDLITELCNDLGLAVVPGLRRHRRRTPDDIAILCAQAAASSRSPGHRVQSPRPPARDDWVTVTPPGKTSPPPH